MDVKTKEVRKVVTHANIGTIGDSEEKREELIKAVAKVLSRK